MVCVADTVRCADVRPFDLDCASCSLPLDTDAQRNLRLGNVLLKAIVHHTTSPCTSHRTLTDQMLHRFLRRGIVSVL
jgi:hypothetical protein